MTLRIIVVILAVLTVLSCTSGLTEPEVREIVQEYTMSGPQGEVGQAGVTVP